MKVEMNTSSESLSRSTLYKSCCATSRGLDCTSCDESVSPSSASSTSGDNFLLQLEEATRQLLDDPCVGGTYIANDQSGSPLAIVKPRTEEPGMKKNPKGFTSEPKPGFKPGEGYKREIAAYLLDHGGFAGVPQTIQFDDGSAQRFVAHDKQSWDVVPGRFDPESVRAIALLDLRLLNCDRHGGNILVNNNSLIPIDHTYVLPTSLSELDFEWMFFPQSKTPFSSSELSYIRSLDYEHDAKILSSLGIEPECIELQSAATLTVQAAAEVGMTPKQVGEFFMRPHETSQSGLETAIESCRRSLTDGGDIDLCKYSNIITASLKEWMSTVQE
eukprot:TRINITY_DN33527_c0_g1_i1.p1 TRINITY_DN33527_c0_g1~~TRINITY_DN33527_c0_g1_i1.p1  ORF type:complete len:330 (+),score=76.73 TRINITY_DN33527_c0_g1_i1:51-1040(+)